MWIAVALSWSAGGGQHDTPLELSPTPLRCPDALTSRTRIVQLDRRWPLDPFLGHWRFDSLRRLPRPSQVQQAGLRSALRYPPVS